MQNLSAIDLKILEAVQQNGQASAQDLADRVNLSPSQAARRRQRLEAEGTITGYRGQVDPAHLGLTVQAFIQIQTAAHSPDAHTAFLRLVKRQREVVAAWTMTGEADYMLRVFCADLAALNTLVQQVLLPHPSVARVHSQIVMEQSKPDAALPT